ncbi:hypothetical protein HII31_13146 [Pseudocercospora fuligena]|uniref:Uncharacterized protein n=1 Tax=Pseudocercospora fuligena TaxID=685502 RepID=A0A8H6R7Z7_9PEZI|nr:hypothetical protein HII31_13146 [Pseudocercospora fuligena]
MITPAHAGRAPPEAARQEAPEMELIAFQPVVEIKEKATHRQLPQYPKEYRLNVVIRSPVRPNVAVHAGNMHASRLTTIIIAKLSQKLRPILGPTIPVDRVATAKFALNLMHVSAASAKGRGYTDQKVVALHT